jgi:hypothetical protein
MMDVMDPYGRQDKYLEELQKYQEQEELKQEEYNKTKEEDKRKLFKLFKNDKEVVDNLYDKIEKGEIFSEVNKITKEIIKKKEEEEKKEEEKKKIINVKKMGKYIKLTGVGESNLYDEERYSRRSDSSDSLVDFDVICSQGKENNIIS